MTALAIPSPAEIETVKAETLAADVIAWSATVDDIGELDDARAKVSAIEIYLRRRGAAAATDLARADRRLEVRIGELLGPAAETQGERTDLSLASDKSDGIGKDDRARFRKIAEHQDDPGVAEAIEAGASRRQVLQTIDAAEWQRQGEEQDAQFQRIRDNSDHTDADYARDAHRSDCYAVLLAIADAGERAAAYTAEEIAAAIDDDPHAHRREQYLDGLATALPIINAYQELIK